MTGVTLDELCAEVNRLITERGISVADGRTASLVTPRNVRYYRTLGLVSAPRRIEGRADYGTDQVDEIIRIKKAQADGVSLDQMKIRRPASSRPATSSADDMIVRSSMANALMAVHSTNRSWSAEAERLGWMSFSRSTTDSVDFGWSTRIGDVTLSGEKDPPSRTQLDAIAAILGQRGVDDVSVQLDHPSSPSGLPPGPDGDLD